MARTASISEKIRCEPDDQAFVSLQEILLKNFSEVSEKAYPDSDRKSLFVQNIKVTGKDTSGFSDLTKVTFVKSQKNNAYVVTAAFEQSKKSAIGFFAFMTVMTLLMLFIVPILGILFFLLTLVLAIWYGLSIGEQRVINSKVQTLTQVLKQVKEQCED